MSLKTSPGARSGIDYLDELRGSGSCKRYNTFYVFHGTEARLFFYGRITDNDGDARHDSATHACATSIKSLSSGKHETMNY